MPRSLKTTDQNKEVKTVSRILHAVFGKNSCDTVYTQSAAQYDRGVVLRISGLALPENYEVHFSDRETGGVSAALSASGSDITIPDAYLDTGDYIYAWIYLDNTDTDNNHGYSGYRVIIPVQKRPAILDMASVKKELQADLDDENHVLFFH